MKYLLWILLFLIPFSLNAEKIYICEADSSIGYSYQLSTKKWMASVFNVEGKKYLISKVSISGYQYEVTKFGSQHRISLCENNFNTLGFLFCSIPMVDMSFKFNKKNGRYILSYMKGYYNVISELVTDSDDNSDTPYIEIGRCSSYETSTQ